MEVFDAKLTLLAVVGLLASLSAAATVGSTSPGGVPASWLQQYEAMLQQRRPTSLGSEDARIMVVLLAPSSAMHSQLLLESVLNKQKYANHYMHDFKLLDFPCDIKANSVHSRPLEHAKCLLLKHQAVHRMLHEHPDKLLWLVNHNAFITNPGIPLQHVLQQGHGSNRDKQADTYTEHTGSRDRHHITAGAAQASSSVEQAHLDAPLVLMPPDWCGSGEMDSFMVRAGPVTHRLWAALVNQIQQHILGAAADPAQAVPLNEHLLLTSLLPTTHQPGLIATSDILAGSTAESEATCSDQAVWAPGVYLGRVGTWLNLGDASQQQLGESAGQRLSSSVSHSRQLAAEAGDDPVQPHTREDVHTAHASTAADHSLARLFTGETEQTHASSGLPHRAHRTRARGGQGHEHRWWKRAHRMHGSGGEHVGDKHRVRKHYQDVGAVASPTQGHPWEEEGKQQTAEWQQDEGKPHSVAGSGKLDDVMPVVGGGGSGSGSGSASPEASTDGGVQRASSLSGTQRDWGKYHLVVRVTAPVMAAFVVIATAYVPLLYWSWSSQHKRVNLLDWRSWVVELEA